MKPFLKWAGIVVGVLLAIILLAVAAVFLISSSRMQKTYNVQPEKIVAPTDAAAVERGRHIAITRGCHDCHGGDYGGALFLDDVPAYLYAPNLTAGEGGIGKSFSDADWVLAIRHGIGPQGKALLFMPSAEFQFLSNADLGDLIAYLKSQPPVNRASPESQARFLGRLLMVTGQLQLLSAEVIDHSASRANSPQPGVSIEYGQYLAAGCTGCHGTGYGGGPIPGAPPDFLPAKNLTPGGDLAGWEEADFINAMRTGNTPDGYKLDPEFMPWPNIGQFTDDELKAIWLFLQSLPAKETGTR